jgi:hypothetical protein
VEGHAETIKALYDETVSELIKTKTEINQLKDAVKEHWINMRKYRQTKSNCPQVVRDFVQWGVVWFGEQTVEGGAVGGGAVGGGAVGGGADAGGDEGGEEKVEEELVVECVICHDEMDDEQTIWECDVCRQDTFHFLCIEHWVRSRRSGEIAQCPLCNAEIYMMEGRYRSVVRVAEGGQS